MSPEAAIVRCRGGFVVGGAVAAACLLKAIVPGETWSGVSGGRPDLMPEFPSWAALALEATATFFMVLLVFATIVADRGGFKPVASFSIGLALTMVATGALAAWSVHHAQKRFRGFGEIMRRAPYVSCALLVILALYMALHGWQALGARHA